MIKNLKKMTTFGVLWSGISQFFTQIFQFIVIVILARLLLPEEFGIVGLTTIFIGLIISINELGLSAAIIQRKDVNQIHLSTSFWASMGTGIILCFLTILLSPFVADFFQQELVKPVLIVSSIGLIIGSLSVVPRAILERKIEFKSITIVEISAAIVSGVVSIFLAIKGMGIWSLVFGTLSSNLISTVILWKISAWKPLLKFSFEHFKELFGFGGHVMGAQIINYIASHIDYLFVGKLLGALSLGYYSLANALVSFPLEKISWMIMRVTFPAFSTIQQDNEILRKGYLKVIKIISLITFPMLAGLFAVAPEFIVFFYGEKWTPMIILVQILCMVGALHCIGAVTSTVQYSKGRADIQFKWQVFTAIMMLVAVIIGSNYGIVGIVSSITMMTFFLVLIIQNITNKLIDLDMYVYLKEIFPATLASIILIFIVEIFKIVISEYDMQLIDVLLSSILIGIIVYVTFIWIFYNNLFDEMKSLVNEIRG